MVASSMVSVPTQGAEFGSFSTDVSQNNETFYPGVVLDKLRFYASQPDVFSRFVGLLGDESSGRRYVEQVMIVVANSEKLQKCSARSIMVAALHAASLELSVLPEMSQGHLVPYGGVCTFIIDYHALVQFSEATGWYDVAPNVIEIFEGEIVTTDRMSGRCVIGGTRSGDKVQGYLGYFKTLTGVERFLFWTNEQCDAWGKKYNPGGFANPKGVWATDRPSMRRKTVLRNLVKRWGKLSQKVQRVLLHLDAVDTGKTLAEVDAGFDDLPAETVIDLSPVPFTVPVSPVAAAKVERGIMHDLGFGWGGISD